MNTRTASCTCGQLKAEASGEPYRVSVCHCLACQRRSGSVFAVQARFLRKDVAVSGQGTEFVRTGDEGSKSRFTFCPRCGDTVFFALEGDNDTIAIPVGAFADPSFNAPTVSVYEERMHSWVKVPQDMEHYA